MLDDSLHYPIHHPQLPQRFLHFPEDQSYGALYVRASDATSLDSAQMVSAAKGTVIVPEGIPVTFVLNKNALRNLSVLTILNTDDIQQMDIQGWIIEASEFIYIRHLRGLDELNLIGCLKSDNPLKHLQSLTTLRSLSLAANQVITDDSLRLLAPLRSLERLNLTLTLVTGEGLAHLHALPVLRSLRLSMISFVEGRIGPVQLSHLRGLDTLEELDIANTGVTGADFESVFPTVPRLRVLGLGQNPITPESLLHLAFLPALEDLRLSEISLPDHIFAAVTALPTLRSLTLYEVYVGDGVLSRLTQAAQLRELTLQGGMLDFEGLGFVTAMPHLHKLDLAGTDGVTRHDLHYLRQLHDLTELHLFSDALVDEDLAFVRDLPQLRTLELIVPAIDGRGLAYLADVEHLHVATVYAPQLTPEQEAFYQSLIGEDKLHFVHPLR